MKFGTTEIFLILALALVLFGGGKLAGVGQALGKSIKDFKKEVKDEETEKEQTNVTEVEEDSTAKQ